MLFSLGTIFYMHISKEGSRNEVEISPANAFANAIKVTTGMLLDHRAMEYAKTFVKVEQDLKRKTKLF